MDYEITPEDPEARERAPRRVVTWPMALLASAGLIALILSAILPAHRAWATRLTAAGAFCLAIALSVIGWRSVSVQARRAVKAITYIGKRIGK